MTRDEIISAVKNNTVNGLKNPTVNLTFTDEQVLKDIANTRSTLIEKYSKIGRLSMEDVSQSINCIDLDCESLSRCCVPIADCSKVKHFSIPKLSSTLGNNAIIYAGPIDRSKAFKVYLNQNFLYQKYKRVTGNNPHVWINRSPNEKGWIDGFVFGTNLVKKITIEAVFDDIDAVLEFECCHSEEDYEYPAPGFIQDEIVSILSNKYVTYFRKLAMPHAAGEQIYRP